MSCQVNGQYLPLNVKYRSKACNEIIGGPGLVAISSCTHALKGNYAPSLSGAARGPLEPDL
jgi:hypothetical protein